jgi:S-DNA-T family DNA segregation ATPase FtsK/SpoIIIE
MDVLVDGTVLHPAWTPPRDAQAGWRIEVVAGPDAGATFPLSTTPVTVGREGDATFTVDDPYLSGRHFQAWLSNDGPVIEDLRSTNGTLVGGAPITSTALLAPGQRFAAGSSVFSLRYHQAGAPTVGGTVHFTRTPFRPPKISEREVDSLNVPSFEKRKRRFGLATALGPLAGSVMFAIVSGNPMYLWIAALSPVIAIWTFFEDRRTGRKDRVTDTADFRREVAVRALQAYEFGTIERDERWVAAPDLAQLAGRAASRTRELWERSPHHAEFGQLRVGLGAVRSQITLPKLNGGDPELLLEARPALDQYELLPAAPVTISLAPENRSGQGVAIVGDQETTAAMARTLLAQIFTLHSPSEMVVLSALSDEGPFQDLCRAGRWAPHARSEFAPIADGWATSMARLLPPLMATVVARAAAGRDREPPPNPHIVVVMSAGAVTDPARFAEFLGKLPGRAVSVIWLGHDVARVPKGCDTQLISSPSNWTLRTVLPGTPDIAFDADLISLAGFERLCRDLAPVDDISAERDDAAIPAKLLLSDALGVDASASDHLASTLATWWASPPKGLRSVVGEGRDGPLELDLVKDGPHTLIAGTTGAGKSEFLQTLLIGLAARYSPERVVFLLIDYGGGTATKDLKLLPHTVGQLRNLDGGLARRALTSLEAEIVRREKALAAHEARDLDELRRVAPENAPPSLIIAVDEFAFLKAEVPDFIPGIVDVAARGRKLGLHLILATQRPDGAIHADIAANVALRVALRVADKQDSTSVIEAPDAAMISRDRPGRGFARRGPADLEEFQTAWAGAPIEARRVLQPVTLAPILSSGRPLRFQPPNPSASPDRTELQAVVDAANAANDSLGLPAPHRPWVEELPEVLTLEELGPMVVSAGRCADISADPGRWIAIGAEDVPERQCWEALVLDLESSGGLLVLGAGGSGKSTTLRTVAIQATAADPANPPVLYAIDFGSGGLGGLRSLPNLATYVSRSQLDRMCQVVELLESHIERRREILANLGVSTWSQLPADERSRHPRIILLIDDLGAIRRAIDDLDTADAMGWFSRLLQIVVDGRAIGVHSIVAATDQRAIPAVIETAVAARMCLFMANSDGYLVAGVDPIAARGRTDQTPGRAFLGRSRPVQVATMAGSDETEPTWLTTLAAETPGAASEFAIVHLPDSLPTADVPLSTLDLLFFGQSDDAPNDYASWAWRGSVLTVVGPKSSGRTTTVSAIVNAAASVGIEVKFVGSRTNSYSIQDEPEWASSKDSATFDGVVVVDGPQQLAGNEDLAQMLGGRSQPASWGVVVTCSPSEFDDYHYSSALQPAGPNDAIIYLQPNVVQARGMGAGRPRPGQRFVPGRGVFVSGSSSKIIQVTSSEFRQLDGEASG